MVSCHLSSWPLCREYENLKEARRASGELADKLKKDLASSRSKVTDWGQQGKETGLFVCLVHLGLLSWAIQPDSSELVEVAYRH